MGKHTVVAPNSALRGHGRIRREGHIEHEAGMSQSELGEGRRVVSEPSRQREQHIQKAPQNATSLLPTLQWLPITLKIKCSIPTMVLRALCDLAATPLLLFSPYFLPSGHSGLLTDIKCTERIPASQPSSLPCPLSGMLFSQIPARLISFRRHRSRDVFRDPPTYNTSPLSVSLLFFLALKTLYTTFLFV